MTRKTRLRLIAISLTLGGVLALFCIQTPSTDQNKRLTGDATTHRSFFLTSATRNASEEKREEQKLASSNEATDLSQQNNVEDEISQEKNVSQVRRMRATAYDLGINSCGKGYGNPSRGISASGINLSGLSREQSMIVSSVEYPLGTKLSIVFPDPYEHYSGVYTVGDTGAFKSGTLDIYVGDFGESTSQEAINFGVRSVEVYVLE